MFRSHHLVLWYGRRRSQIIIVFSLQSYNTIEKKPPVRSCDLSLCRSDSRHGHAKVCHVAGEKDSQAYVLGWYRVQLTVQDDQSHAPLLRRINTVSAVDLPKRTWILHQMLLKKRQPSRSNLFFNHCVKCGYHVFCDATRYGVELQCWTTPTSPPDVRVILTCILPSLTLGTQSK